MAEADDPASSYAWIDDWDPVSIGFCLTLIEALDPRRALELMVGDPPLGPVSASEAREWAIEQTVPAYATAIEASRIGDWAITIELNGFLSTLDDVIERVTAGTRAVVIFRNVNAVMRFIYAAGGRVLRTFDPLLFAGTSPQGGAALPEESGLTFGLGHPIASAFTLAERLTNVRLTRSFLEDRHDWIGIAHYSTYALDKKRSWRADLAAAERAKQLEPPLPVPALLLRRWGGRLPSEGLLNLESNSFILVQLDRDLIDEIETATPEKQRFLANWAARRAYSAAGIDNWAADALDALDEGRPLPAPFDDRYRLFELLYQDPDAPHTLVSRPEGGPRNVVQQSMAIPALHGAAAEDPLKAAIDALAAAVVTVGDEYPVLFDEVRNLLGTCSI